MTNEQFWEKIDRIETYLFEHSTVFVQECFSDWIYDLESTDWDYYDMDYDQWMKSIYSRTDDQIIKELEEFGRNYEKLAYEEGYLPSNEGVDVREWSQFLSDYYIL